MTINADTLLDRLYLKGQLTKWRVIAIVAIVLAVLAAVEKGGDLPMTGNYIARLTIEGVIFDDPKRDELIQELKDNNRVKAVIVRLDTPGGSAVGGEELYLRLKELSKVKPVVSTMRTLATSAGYMTALGTDYIIAREGTITGSIGVIMQMAEVTNLAEKLGITPITIKSGPLKGSPSPLEKMSPESNAVMQAVVRDFYETFVNMIVERRKLPRERVVELADGRVYTGKQAINLKLIDAIGGEEEAVAWLVKQKNIDEDLKIQDVAVEKEEESLLDRISNISRHAIFKEMLVKLDGLSLIWQANTL